MDLLEAIRERAARAVPGGAEGVTIDPPRDPAHGDLTTNAALLGDGPARGRAKALAAALAADPLVAAARVAGPGFVNLDLSDAALEEVRDAAIAAGARFGAGQGPGGAVSVEFASAYPTGPLTPSHLRQAVVGDALARVLEFAGHRVVRDYYVGDGGAQADTLARAVRQAQIAPEGGPLDALAAGAPAAEGPEAEWLPALRAHAVARILEGARADLLAAGIAMDRFTSERALLEGGAVAGAVAQLERAGLVDKGLRWTFAASRMGDERDRPVRLETGEWTYFAADIAAHRARLDGASALVDVLGADHAAYVRRLTAAVAALSGGRVPLDVRLVAPVTGGPATAREVLDALGADGARLTLLSRKPDAPLELDLAAARAVTAANPAWAVHAAAGRLAAGTEGRDRGRAVLAKVAEWPRVARRAARLREPQRVAAWLLALAERVLPALDGPGGLDAGTARAALAATRAALACLGVRAPEGLG